jgi:hypothetical protein
MMAPPARQVLRFPTEHTAHPARGGAGGIGDSLRLRARQFLGRVANWLHLPAPIQSTEIYDRSTGQHIAVTVGDLLVRLTVDGRDFYFHRITGRFDGTGSENS